MARRILDETTASTLNNDDFLYVDGATGGARKITADDMVRSTYAVQQLAEHIEDATGDVEQTKSDMEGIRADLDDAKKDIIDTKDELNEYADIFTGDVGEAVSNWLNEHPEKTTTVQDNSLTTAKYMNGSVTTGKVADKAVTKAKLADTLKTKINMVDGQPQLKMVHSVLNGINNLEGVPEGYYLQAATYNSNDNCFIVYFCNASYDAGVLVKLDTDFETVIVSVSIDLGHGNDLEYYEPDNTIYVATGNSGSYANQIVVLDASTFGYVKSDYLGLSSNAKWMVCYNSDKNVFYAKGNNDYIFVFDANLNVIETITTMDIVGWYSGGLDFVSQNSLYVNGKYLMMYMEQATVEGNSFYLGTHILEVNIENETVEKYASYRSFDYSFEPEAIVVADGVGYLFGGQVFFRVSKIFFDKTDVAEPNINIFDSGENILLNTDLDNLQVAGKYTCINSTIAATLGNVPAGVASGFTLLVVSSGYNYLTQIIISNVGRLYNRTLNPIAGWTTWKQYLDDTIQKLELTGKSGIALSYVEIYADLKHVSGSFRFNFSTLPSQNGYVEVAKLPSGYKPRGQTYIHAIGNNGQIQNCFISTSGNIDYYYDSSKGIATSTQIIVTLNFWRA